MRLAPPENPRHVLPRDLLCAHWAHWGYTGRDLARRLDVTPKHVSELMRGKARITAAVALKLERVFGLEMSYWQGCQIWLDLRRARHAARRKVKSHPGSP